MKGVRLLSALSAIGLLAGACAPTEPESPSQATYEPADDDLDWSDRPLTRVGASLDGLRFSVGLPEGLEAETRAASGVVPEYVTWRGHGALSAPRFSAQIDPFPPADVDDAGHRMTAGIEVPVVMRAEKLADGTLLATIREGSRRMLRTQIWRRSDDGRWVRFSVVQRAGDPIPDLEGRAAWMEMVARTFELN